MSFPLDEEEQALQEHLATQDRATEVPIPQPMQQAPGELGPGPVAPAGPTEQQVADETRPQSVAAVTKSAPAPVTSANPAQPAAPKSRGFDWARALYVAGGGNATDIDKIRAAPGERRDAELQNQLKTSQFQDLQTQRQLARDALDPNSKLSQDARDRFSAKMNQYNTLFSSKHPDLAEAIKNSAANASGKTAAEIARIEADTDKHLQFAKGLMESDSKASLAQSNAGLNERKTAAAELQARNTGMNIGSQVADRRDDNLRQQEQLSEQVRHNKAIEEGGSQRMALKHEKDQEKLNEKVAGLNEQEDLLGLAKEQAKKTNTGFFNNKLQQGLKYIGLESKDFDNLESTLAGVTNQIIKLQAGGNVTSGEAARMRQQLPSMDMDEQEFNTKLEAVMRQVALKKQNAGKQYERKEDGSVRDSAPIGKELVGQQAQSTADKARAVLSDKNSSDKAKAGAQKWLSDHGF